MKIKKIITIYSIICISASLSFAQADNIIRITNTQIISPQVIDAGTINEEGKFIKILISNERNNTVEIKNINTPEGLSVSLKKQSFDPKSQTPLYIGIKPGSDQDTGLIKKSVIIETNLIVPIVIKIRARVNPKSK